MKLKIYYDDIDGELHPKIVLLPNLLAYEQDLLAYNVEAPFERFYQEDFHDDLRLISVSQGALKTSPLYSNLFEIDINILRKDIESMKHDPESIEEADYFVCLVDDLEELLSYDVSNRFIIH